MSDDGSGKTDWTSFAIGVTGIIGVFLCWKAFTGKTGEAE